MFAQKEAKAMRGYPVSRLLPDVTNTTMDFKLRFIESGRIAFRGGLDRKACPLAPKSPARMWWLYGYADAKKRAGGNRRPA